MLENTTAEVWINEPSKPGDIISPERRRHLVLMPRDIDEGESRDVVMKVKMTSHGAGARIETYILPTIEQMGFALCFVPLSLSLLTWGIWTTWSELARGFSFDDDRVWVPVTVPLLLLGMYTFLAWARCRQLLVQQVHQFRRSGTGSCQIWPKL